MQLPKLVLFQGLIIGLVVPSATGAQALVSNIVKVLDKPTHPLVASSPILDMAHGTTEDAPATICAGDTEGCGTGCCPRVRDTLATAKTAPDTSVRPKLKRDAPDVSTNIITKTVYYAPGHEPTATCSAYNFCSVKAWGSSTAYSLTYLCEMTPSPMPTVAQSCPTYSFCTAKAWSGTSNYPITHVCHDGGPTVTVNLPKNTGQVMAQTSGTVTVYETEIVQTSFQVTVTSSACSSVWTQTLGPYGTLIAPRTSSAPTVPSTSVSVVVPPLFTSVVVSSVLHSASSMSTPSNTTNADLSSSPTGTPPAFTGSAASGHGQSMLLKIVAVSVVAYTMVAA